MNVFVFVFLFTAVVTAAPASEKHHKDEKSVNSTHQEYHRSTDLYYLKEVIHHVRNLKNNLTEKILQKNVQNVFMNENCSRETLCKAGKVLSAFSTSDLRLTSGRDWRLPRIIHSYSCNCTKTDKLDSIPLRQLLDEIQRCAQQEHAKPH